MASAPTPPWAPPPPRRPHDGIGQNSAPVRERICTGLEHLGIQIDLAKNAARSDEPRAIQQAGAPLQILVLPTNEELQIALETKQIIESR
ncbi:MAG: hypothetical protein AB7V14_06270 [Kiritimatiellia bacterium]